jgi:four helix bundle protein
MHSKFRFQDLIIWKDAISIGNDLYDIADQLEAKKYYRFSEQLRAAALSMSNNIAEGSGSKSKKEFHQFLNIARRSTFENANMLIVFAIRKLINNQSKEELLDRLDHLCSKITNFQRTLV